MIFPELLHSLRDSTVDVDRLQMWPAQQLQDMAAAGVMKMGIPELYGGTEVTSLEMTETYRELSAACLTSTFILTQRNGACQRIAGCDNEPLKVELLPRLAEHEIFATVGISHLTTSRQHIQKPAVEVEIQHDSLVLNGQIPWVTGAEAADWIITGGTCADGRQVLIALPVQSSGVTVNTPVQLMALTASRTGSVTLDHVQIPKSHLLAGPIENVMSHGTGGGAGSATTSTLALGVAQRMVELLNGEAETRTQLKHIADQFQAEHNELNQALIDNILNLPGCAATYEIRQRANLLALRITQAALTATKGAGYVVGHPVELAVREAMFFLVWSCPSPVADGILHHFSCSD